MSETTRDSKDKRSLSDLGIIYVGGDIDAGTAETVCTEIIDINLNRRVDSIQLIINSPGGSVSAGFAIIDMMGWSRLPVRTTALGMVASTALLIFMAGHRGQRVLTPRVSVLSHRFSWWVMGNHSELVARRKEEDLIHSRILDHYREYTAISDVEELQRTLLCDVDTWLSAEEAVTYGLADIIEGKRAQEASA